MGFAVVIAVNNRYNKLIRFSIVKCLSFHVKKTLFTIITTKGNNCIVFIVKQHRFGSYVNMVINMCLFFDFASSD